MSPEDITVLHELDWRIKVFESLSFPTLILKPDRTIVSANKRFLERYEVDMDSVVGKTCHEFLYSAKDPWSIDLCPLAKVLMDKQGHSTLKRVITRDGQERYEDRVFSPILDKNGEVAYIIESLRDVTRLKVLEKELGVTKEFLEEVIESSPSAIMAADLKGKILVINQAAEELFGYSTEGGVKEYNVRDLYAPGIAKEIMKQLRDSRFGGKGRLRSTRIDITNARGEEVPTEITAAIIYESDREVATMGIFNDLREKIAAEKKLQEVHAQLIQSEKLASIGQLAAGVAHEINNPMTGILFYANLVKDSFAEGDPRREDMDFIIEDVHRCKEIVKNLLAYSRQHSPTKNIYQINQLVDQALTLIRDPKLFANIEVARELSDEMMMVHVDRNQLSQVLINLTMNAVAAMDGRGVLTFRTHRNKALRKVYLEVSDTGHGIPEEHLKKIFDPFFTTKELGKGTGLGLSTVYGIVQENDGTIYVKETSPEGTTFVVELPLYHPSDE